MPQFGTGRFASSCLVQLGEAGDEVQPISFGQSLSGIGIEWLEFGFLTSFEYPDLVELDAEEAPPESVMRPAFPLWCRMHR